MELYDTRSDFSLTNDLASKNPEKLHEMQAIFMREAIANHVLPIDDRTFERANPELAGRPDLMAGRKSLTVYDGMFSIPENAFIYVKNSSFSITADVIVPDQPANGVLVAQGGRFGGWSLYVKEYRHAGLPGLYESLQVQWEDREGDDRSKGRQDQSRRQRRNRAAARRIEPQEGIVELNLSSVGATSASGQLPSSRTVSLISALGRLPSSRTLSRSSAKGGKRIFAQAA